MTKEIDSRGVEMRISPHFLYSEELIAPPPPTLTSGILLIFAKTQNNLLDTSGNFIYTAWESKRDTFNSDIHDI